MIFQHFLLSANESNLYLIGCEETREAALIDAGAYDPRVTDFVARQRLKVKMILLTHGHWDHTGGVDDYRESFDCPALGFANLPEGRRMELGRLALVPLPTTGHTSDSLSFYMKEEGVLFSGDALFAGSVGGTENEAKKAEQLRNIRERILTLPEATLIYPGHGPASSVGTEKHCNPFLK